MQAEKNSGSPYWKAIEHHALAKIQEPCTVLDRAYWEMVASNARAEWMALDAVRVAHARFLASPNSKKARTEYVQSQERLADVHRFSKCWESEHHARRNKAGAPISPDPRPPHIERTALHVGGRT
jgi:hypothetical protein